MRCSRCPRSFTWTEPRIGVAFLTEITYQHARVFIVQSPIQYGMKRRIEWSALLLFVLGLCSMAAPHKMVHATVHHQQMPSCGSGGTRTSRTTRQNGRSARGGMTTEMDTHGSDTDHASQGVRPREVTSVASVVVAAIVTPRFLQAPSPARGSIPAAEDVDVALSYDALPSRGRAPPAL